MNAAIQRPRVGEVRPSQLLFTFGVGSVIDLPNLSTMVMGLDDWNVAYVVEIGEERLLNAVRTHLGAQVERLNAPPLAAEADTGLISPFTNDATIGVPVAPFPRWMRCPWCNLLAPLSSDLFDLKVEPYHPDRTKYVHTNCTRPGRPPTVLPARFLVACAFGHLDDFPWIFYVHGGVTQCKAQLRLREYGVSGEASDVEVRCDTCGATRRMADAFGETGPQNLPSCRGRRPHLRDFAEQGCGEPMKSILLGASNSWFPITLSALSVPTASNRLAQLVEEHWPVLERATSLDIVKAFRQIGQLRSFAEYTEEELWAAITAKREAIADDGSDKLSDLKAPEWAVFSKPDPMRNTEDFRLTPVSPPPTYGKFFSQVVLVERLREVRALLGFTRIESPGDFADIGEIPPDRRAPLARKPPRWVPASEVRGEGIFIEFNESAVATWSRTPTVVARGRGFYEAHQQWRRVRRIPHPEAGFPGIRYVLLHSFAHALMRQLALECGYTAASIRERIYARDPGDPDGPMAGVLLYTAAADSEGTLGGLVSLGEPSSLGRHLDHAFEQMRLCASDPLCAEHHPHREGVTLHGASCHACLFASETSCERGNKYLDRSVLVRTFGPDQLAFFEPEG